MTQTTPLSPDDITSLTSALEVMPAEQARAIINWVTSGAKEFAVIVHREHRSYVDCVHLSHVAALADLAAATAEFRKTYRIVIRDFEDAGIPSIA